MVFPGLSGSMGLVVLVSSTDIPCRTGRCGLARNSLADQGGGDVRSLAVLKPR